MRYSVKTSQTLRWQVESAELFWAPRVILDPKGYDQIVLVKCLLIGQWHGVSDPKLEETLHDRFDALLFAGLDLHCAVRDETPHFRSRNARVRAGA